MCGVESGVVCGGEREEGGVGESEVRGVGERGRYCGWRKVRKWGGGTGGGTGGVGSEVLCVVDSEVLCVVDSEGYCVWGKVWGVVCGGE